jgi:uncharacterized membrane protein YgdD (TMEM256/DUF423 family)
MRFVTLFGNSGVPNPHPSLSIRRVVRKPTYKARSCCAKRTAITVHHTNPVVCSMSEGIHRESLAQIAAVLGGSGVGLGAMGAHQLAGVLAQKGLQDNWRTAVLYQLFHASAIVGLSALCASHETAPEPRKSALLSKYRTAGQLWGVGTVLFSGSIYCLCLGIGPRKILGPTTPIGGLLMIGGWAMLGLAPYLA